MTLYYTRLDTGWKISTVRCVFLLAEGVMLMFGQRFTQERVESTQFIVRRCSELQLYLVYVVAFSIMNLVRHFEVHEIQRMRRHGLFYVREKLPDMGLRLGKWLDRIDGPS